jgi:hypothetical protein
VTQQLHSHIIMYHQLTQGYNGVILKLIVVFITIIACIFYYYRSYYINTDNLVVNGINDAQQMEMIYKSSEIERRNFIGSHDLMSGQFAMVSEYSYYYLNKNK